MKRFIRSVLALALLGTVAQFNSAARGQFLEQRGQQSVVLSIHADGTCEVVNRSVLPRAAAAQQVQMMERMQKMEEAGDDPAQLAALGQATATNTLTDDQLKEKFKTMMGEEMGGVEGGDKEPDISVDKENVTTTQTASFPSVHDMLAGSGMLLNSFAASFENMRFEQDANGHLLVTLTPGAMQKRELKSMRSMFKMSGLHSEMKFVFPGKVISSSFPETQTNATWITVDASKDESLDALAKLYDGPDTITAELAGLTLKEPLESKSLMRHARRPSEMGDDLPITEGATGFVAEPEGIVTTTLHVFPEGTNYFKGGNMFVTGPPGTMVHAKLFPPKGRTLQSVNDIKLLKATDDQGRPVAAGDTDEGGGISSAYVESGGMGGRNANAANVQLHLQLPAPDAQAIDEISAEAVAVTAGSWKELVLTNVTESTTNEVDLSEVLPGAKLVLSKLSNKDNQFSVQARITGPATVNNLKVEAKAAGADDNGNGNGNSNSYGERSQTTGGQTVRTVHVNAFFFNMNGPKTPASYNLIIRYPQDLRRDRVNFKLKGLDLL